MYEGLVRLGPVTQCPGGRGLMQIKNWNESRLDARIETPVKGPSGITCGGVIGTGRLIRWQQTICEEVREEKRRYETKSQRSGSRSRRARFSTPPDAAVPSLDLPNPGRDRPAVQPQASPGAELANYSNLPKADANVPDAQFVELNSGYQIGALFYALSSGSPPDYEQLSMAVSHEYRSTDDTFRKRDLMQGLKPQIDQQIQAYKDKRNRYFTAKVGSYLSAGNLLVLKHYDFKTNSFPLAQDMSPNTLLQLQRHAFL